MLYISNIGQQFLAGFVPLAVLLLFFYLLKRKSYTTGHRIGGFLLAATVILILILTGIPNLFDWHFDPHLNFTPFRDYTFNATSYHLNIVLFFPIGFLLPLFWKRFGNFFATMFTGIFFSAAIEVLQMFAGRISDVDDLIMNSLGTLLGFIIFLMIRLIFPRFRKYLAASNTGEVGLIFLFGFLVMFILQPIIMNNYF
ncbi:VanZ family protein [Enterococcus timonensis]|uniref:VanZ family protein n=1 Tax=Enterococcus timonensis TaxID=1852364 RepID=UPI0008DB3063|nr:VanZ family protein [Enterococcus timonensis]